MQQQQRRAAGGSAEQDPLRARMEAVGRVRRRARGTASPPDARGTWEAVKAGGRGAIDSLPFGIGDHGMAGIHTAIDLLRGEELGTAYFRRLAAERAQNRYDEAVHPLARTAGKVAGSVAQLVVPGLGPLRAVRASRRMAKATPLIFREMRNFTALGAGAGVGTQAAADAARGQVGSIGDYAGSALGGGVGAWLALRGRPGLAGGGAGGATSFGQDLFNGRIGSGEDLRAAVDRAAEWAAAGNLIGGSSGAAVARAVKALPPNPKGRLGEALSERRSRLRGQKIDARQRRIHLKRGWTNADHVTADRQVVEAKLGETARLRPRQVQAFRELPDYRVDHFLPDDVGIGIELPTGLVSSRLFGDWDERESGR